MGLTIKIVIAVTLGALFGLLINVFGSDSPSHWLNYYIVDGAFYIIGNMFINALTMLVVPLVFFSLLCGVCGIGDIKVLGRVGGKAFLFYMATTALAIMLAIFLAASFNIGHGMTLTTESEFNPAVAPNFTDIVIGLIPTNPIAAMASGDMLPLIVFTILFGISVLALGSKAKTIVEGAESLNAAMMKMVMVVMSVAPYAVFALIARSVADLGFDLLTQLALYITVLVLALLLHLFGTLMLILRVFTGMNLRIFLHKVRAMQLFAFSTSSSNATIPVTLRTVEKRLGVDNAIASFTVPFGATINMDGTAIMQGVATVFIANLYGIDLGLADYVTVILMAVLASIGTAGVPGVGLVMLSMVFGQVGIPVEGIGLILGVDRIMDMLRTAVNVTGDAVVTVAVAKSEGRLAKNIYLDPTAR